LEKETTETVENLFGDIDDVLFDNVTDGFGLSGGDGGADAARTMSKELKQECDIWKRRFPHIR
jgi:hypothetical protein